MRFVPVTVVVLALSNLAEAAFPIKMEAITNKKLDRGFHATVKDVQVSNTGVIEGTLILKNDSLLGQGATWVVVLYDASGNAIYATRAESLHVDPPFEEVLEAVFKPDLWGEKTEAATNEYVFLRRCPMNLLASVHSGKVYLYNHKHDIEKQLDRLFKKIIEKAKTAKEVEVSYKNLNRDE